MPLRWLSSASGLKVENQKDVDFVSGKGLNNDVPCVETLAGWLANEEWLPNLCDGAIRSKPAAEDLWKMVWGQLPQGLQTWCLRFEPTLWKGGEILEEFERLVGDMEVPKHACLAEKGSATMCGCEGGYVQHCEEGHAGEGMHPCMDESFVPKDESLSGLEKMAMHGNVCGDVQVGEGLCASRKSGERYFGYKCKKWMEMVVEKMVMKGMSREDCAFVWQKRFGFGEDFGKVCYSWNEEREKLRMVYSIVDKFVSLMMGCEKPSCIVWDPIARVVEPTDWKAGGVHEKSAVETWESLHGVSSWVMDWVKNGFYVEPLEKVPCSEKRNASFLDPRSRQFDEERFRFAEEKLKKDEGLGVIRRLGPSKKPDNVNRISLAPKNSEKEPWRLVGDIRFPNSKYGKKKVKFETLRHVSEIFEPGDWLFLADQKAAYHSMFVQERLARQLGFCWKGIYYKWLSLPFGFIHSPYCFQRLMRQLVKHWRWLERKLLQFLDDGMGGHSSFVEGVMQRNELFNLMHALGLRLSTKSSPLLEQTKEFLGMIVHTAGEVNTFHVPEKKVEKLQALLHDMVEMDAWTMRKLAKVTGKLLSMSLAIPMSRIMSRSLYACMHTNDKGAWDDLMKKEEEVIKELKWIAKAIVPFNKQGFPIWVKEEIVDFDITADASPVAGGFKIEDALEEKIRMVASVAFRPEESEMAQCHRELWIVCLLVRGLAFQLHGKKIRIRVDAKTTELYWKNGGGKSPILTNMTKLLWATCVANRITVVDVVHIPGTRMVEEGVDDLSRPKKVAFGSEKDRAEWSLTGEGMACIQAWLGGPISFDRFASRVNRKCVRYNAARWEPEAVAPASAFAEQHNWRLQPGGEWEWNFCFPPHHLIAKCLSRIEKDKAWACMVVPNWPSQTWWPKLRMHALSWKKLGKHDMLRRMEGGKWVPIKRAPFEMMAVVVDCRFL